MNVFYHFVMWAYLGEIILVGMAVLVTIVVLSFRRDD